MQNETKRQWKALSLIVCGVVFIYAMRVILLFVFYGISNAFEADINSRLSFDEIFHNTILLLFVGEAVFIAWTMCIICHRVITKDRREAFATLFIGFIAMLIPSIIYGALAQFAGIPPVLMGIAIIGLIPIAYFKKPLACLIIFVLELVPLTYMAYGFTMALKSEYGGVGYDSVFFIPSIYLPYMIITLAISIHHFVIRKVVDEASMPDTIE